MHIYGGYFAERGAFRTESFFSFFLTDYKD